MSEESKSMGMEEQEVESVHQGMPDSRGKRRSPWLWVPSSYYAEGVPLTLVSFMSVIMYKKMGISNKDIAYYTSLLYLPWVIKPLWSPIVDIFKTKRWWVIIMQLLLSIGMMAIALVLPLPAFFKISLAFLWLVAISSATHDIACDGFYMLGLTKHQQTWFVGVRTTFYKFAIITGQGLLVVIAGWIEAKSGLDSVPVHVAATIESRPKMEYIRCVPLSQEESGALEKMPYIDQLQFYVEKSKTAQNLDMAATYAYLADQVLAKLRKLNPNDPKIPKANELFSIIAQPLDHFMKDKISVKNNEVKQLEGSLRIIVSDEELNIPIQTIPENDAQVTLFAAKRWNILQGQMEETGKEMKEKKPGWVKKKWKEHVSASLENFMKKYFAPEKKSVAKLAGNIGYVYFHLSKPPDAGRKVTVGFGRKRGDNSIALKEGMRIIFTKENWNKPLLAAIQIEPTVKDTTEAGFLATAGNIPLSWTIVFVMMSILMLVFCIYHYFILPLPYSDTSRYEEAHRSGTPFKAGDFLREFYETFFSFFRKRGIIAILLFLCLFRFAEAQLIKMSSPFMLDSQEKGGLALTTGQVGIAYGTVGWLMQIVGSILGGLLAARDGLKKWVWWMCLAINIPDLVYVFMSYAHPASFAIICTCVAIETFGYGFGFTAYTLFMIQAAEGKHKTAHFAIATGFMALGMMVPGMFSGWIQSIIGYQHFFTWIMLATIPGFLVVALIKIDPEFGKKKTAKASV